MIEVWDVCISPPWKYTGVGLIIIETVAGRCSRRRLSRGISPAPFTAAKGYPPYLLKG